MKDESKGAQGEELSIIEQILNGTADKLTLLDESENEVEFEWIATVPYKNGEETRIYCILKPTTQVEGVADDEAIVFKIYEQWLDGFEDLEVESDLDVAEAVFAEYEKLCESEE